jgi:hypothetical protein
MASAPSSRSHPRLALALAILASLTVFVAIFAVWAKRQALDNSEWTKTSSELLQKESIRNAVSTYLVDQLYSNVDVAGQLKAELPPAAKPLAPTAAGALRELALRATNRALASPRFQQAWENANKVAHQEFVDVVEDKNSAALSTSGGNVVLDLKPLLLGIAQQVGLSGKRINKLPADAAQIQIMRSNQLDAAQKVTKLVRGLAIALPLVWLGLAILAVWLGHPRRRETIRALALGGLAAGIGALLLRGAGQNAVTGALAKTAAVEPAVNDAWNVGTSLLTDVAQSVIVVALGLLIVAWLAGNTRPAVAFRRVTAPYMRERPDLVYGVVAVIFLILVVWHPAHVLTRPLALLIIAVFMVIGTEALRRQIEREFPDAVMPPGGIREAIASVRSPRGEPPRSEPGPK